MKSFTGKTLRWDWRDGIIELTLDREPANEIGTAMLADLEKFVAAFPSLAPQTSACIISSARKHGFSAGADLRELYEGAAMLSAKERLSGVRSFLERIHAVLNAIDAAAFVTIAAVHGVCFGGGLELALACDIIVADKMARFAFPELRLGLIPGFGGIPRLKRDLGNAFVRDLLLTGRSVNATRAHAVGLVAQLTAEGEALKIARVHRRANHEVRRRHPRRRQEIHQAHPTRRAPPRNRSFLRALHASRSAGRPQEIRRVYRRHALPAIGNQTRRNRLKQDAP